MEKKIYLIAAMSDNRVIGRENRLPWHYSADLKKFKELTIHHTIIMGRRTFDSIGKPLPNRFNYVLTHFPGKKGETDHLKFFSSLKNAVNKAETDKVFIIGGGSLFRQVLSTGARPGGIKLTGIYLTQIHEEVEGDAFFPKIPESFKKMGEPEILQGKNPKIDFIYLENTELRI